MSILIKGMKMPKSCVECHWYYECYDEHCTLGKFILRKYTTDASEEPYILDVQRHPDCPLIEIDQEAIDIAQDIIDGCKRFKDQDISNSKEKEEKMKKTICDICQKEISPAEFHISFNISIDNHVDTLDFHGLCFNYFKRMAKELMEEENVTIDKKNIE